MLYRLNAMYLAFVSLKIQLTKANTAEMSC